MRTTSSRFALAGLSGTVFLACLIGQTAIAGPRIVGPQDPGGKEVRETAGAFYHAIADGNAASAHALFAGPQDQAALVDAELEAVAASRRMSRSVLSHFGPDNPNLLTSSAVVLFIRLGDRQSNGLIVFNGDEASTLSIAEPNNGLLLRKMDGRWTVVQITQQHFRGSTAVRKYFTQVAAAYDDVRKKVDGGQYKSADATFTAVQKALDVLNRQLGPDPADAARPPAPPIKPAPTAERLRALMGRQIMSSQVANLIDSLPCMPALSEFRDALFVSVPELGLDLSFKLPDERLQAAHLYGGTDRRFSRYTGTLPAGLAFGQQRIDVERRLGRPASFSGWVESGIAAEYPNLKLLVQYAPGPVRNPHALLTTITLIETPSYPIATTRPFTEPPPQLTICAVLDEGNPAPADRLPDPQDPAGIATLRVSRQAIIDQNSIANVHAVPGENDVDAWKVSMDLTPEGGRRLFQATKNLVGRRVAIVLGSRVLMAPIVRDPISDHVMIDFGSKPQRGFPDELLRQMSLAMMSLAAPESSSSRTEEQ